MPNWPPKSPQLRGSSHASQFEKRLFLESQFRELKHAKRDESILHIIEQSTTAIAEALCIEASKKFLKWGHWKALRNLIDVLITKECTIPVRVYDMLIQILCFKDKLEKAFATFLEMEMQNVIPNKQIIRRIIHMCKKRKNGVHIAENVWNKMLNVFKIVPDLPLYGAIIGVYAFHRNIEKTEFYFQEILKQTDKKNSHILERICGHMFRLYGSVNEEDKTYKMEQFMIRNGIGFDAYVYTNLIRAYLIFEQVEKAIKVFEKIQTNELVDVDTHILGTVAAAYLKGIALCCSGDKKDWTKIHKYLRIMSHDLPLRYPTLVGKRYKTIVFDAVLWKYLNNWKHEAVAEAFQQAFTGEQMGCSYWTFWNDENDHKLHRPAIDFHNLSHISVRYILRRIFCFETHNLKVFSPLFVVCGKGNHRTHTHLTIKETIVDELHGWNPQIRTSNVDFNEGLMSFNADDVTRFLNTNQNVCPSSNCFSELTYDPFYKVVGTQTTIGKMTLMQKSRALTPVLIERKQRKITKLLPLSVRNRKLSWPAPAPGLPAPIKPKTKDQMSPMKFVEAVGHRMNGMDETTESNYSDGRLSDVTSAKSCVSNNDEYQSEYESEQSEDQSSYYSDDDESEVASSSSEGYNVFEDKEYKALKRKYDHKKQKYDLRHQRYLEVKKSNKMMVMKYEAVKQRLEAMKAKNKELVAINKMSKELYQEIRDEMDEYDAPHCDQCNEHGGLMNEIYAIVFISFILYNAFFRII